MRHCLATAVVLAGMAVLPAAATAQDTTTATQIPEADVTFAQNAATANLAEVELGKMAADKATNEDVQAYGQDMADDHGKAQDQLEEIADDKNIDLSSDLPADKQQVKDRLDELSGADFDRAYMEQMVADHEKTVELFQNQADKGQDPELKNYAQQTLPMLQEHLDRAKQLQTQISQMAATTGGSPEATEPAAGATTTQQAAVAPSAFGAMTAEELIGKPVVNQKGEKVGELTDIVIDKQNKVVSGIVSVGGFLGIGEKHVAVPFDQLKPGDNEAILMSSASEEDLKAMPEYDEKSGTYEEYPRDQPMSSNQ